MWFGGDEMVPCFGRSRKSGGSSRYEVKQERGSNKYDDNRNVQEMEPSDLPSVAPCQQISSSLEENC